MIYITKYDERHFYLLPARVMTKRNFYMKRGYEGIVDQWWCLLRTVFNFSAIFRAYFDDLLCSFIEPNENINLAESHAHRTLVDT